VFLAKENKSHGYLITLRDAFLHFQDELTKLQVLPVTSST
jgi:hypothetical protein